MTDKKSNVEIVPPMPPVPPYPIQAMIQPTTIPQLEWGRNFISRFLHNWQLEDIAAARMKECETSRSTK